MTSMLYLLPISIFLALVSLAAFLWCIRTGQYDDPAGEAERMLQARDTPLNPRKKR